MKKKRLWMVILMTNDMRRKMEARLEKIPSELTKIPHWVGWRYVPQPEPKKPKKVPINPRTGSAASSKDPSTWSAFNAAVRHWIDIGDVDGIGFMLGVEESTESIVGIDLDYCRDPETKEVEPRFAEIIEQMRTYTEVSPSGCGFRLFARGRLPAGNRVFNIGTCRIELFDSRHFLTVTGRRIPNMPHTIEERSAELETLFRQLSEQSKPEKKNTELSSVDPDTVIYDRAITAIRNMADTEPLKLLWNGDYSGYLSQSEADLAFCTRVALRSGCNNALIDHVFRRSKLFRKKWDEIHEQDGRTYGQMTIQKAVSTAAKEFRKKHNVATTSELTAQLSDWAERPHIVRDLIPARSLVLVAGDSTLGKSPYLYQMALCVATGRPFLGHEVTRGRTLYCDFENGLVDVDEILRGLREHLGIADDPKRFLPWNFNHPAVKGTPHGQDIRQMMSDFHPSLVIIDSLASYDPMAEKNTVVAAKLLANLRMAIRASGATIVLIHNLRKPSAKKNEAPESLEGDMRRWFQQVRGPRVLFNGSDVRIGVAEPHSARIRIANKDAEIAFVTRGFARVRGEIPISYISRVFDSAGKPLGYEKLTGEELLFNAEQETCYRELPDFFRFTQARRIYGKASQPTDNFLKKCMAIGILQKTNDGYEKISQK
jgi:hypothetical protein